MSGIQFTVWIEPRAKGRPRATSAGGFVRQYTPAKTRHWEHEFAARAEQHAPEKPLSGPISIGCVFVFRRPQRLNRRRDPQGLIKHQARPDLDNCIKATLDALGSWFENGDQQIQTLTASKHYSERGSRPRIEITIEEEIQQ